MPIRPQHDRPSERELAALADGSLAPAHRAYVERAVAESPELLAQLRDQRLALDALRAASEVRAPAALRARVGAARPRAPRRGLSIAAATGAAAVAGVLLAASGGGGPTVADAAALGARPAMAAAPDQRHGPATLERPAAAGLRFPYWGDRFGWRATGVRYDRLDGRPATTVFYRRHTEVVAYTIVGGAALPEASGSVFHGRRTVTWLRRGHSCVLSSTRTARTTLLRLAAWRGGGEIAF